MYEWALEVWTTKAGFTRLVKAVLIIVAGGLATGAFGTLPQGWVGALMPWITAALGVGLPAGDTNRTPAQVATTLREMGVAVPRPPKTPGE